MAKDWNVRLTETIAFIKKTPAPGFTGDRQFVTAALDEWNQTSPADQRKQLSELMSQEKATNRPAKGPDRAYRRAAILLECAVISPDQATWPGKAKVVNTDKASPAGLYTMAFGTAYDAVGSGAKAGPNLAFLLASPADFLRKYKISVNGRNTAGPFEYGFAMDGGTYKIKAGNPDQTPTKLRAINVPAVLFDAVERSLDSLTGTRSSDHEDCSIMLTTQFTGCTYCFALSADRSSLVAAHIDPGGGIGRTSTHTGESVSKALRENGGFRNGNGGVFRAYGRVSNGAEYGYPLTASQMIITALKGKSGWKVFAQIAEANGFRVERIDK